MQNRNSKILTRSRDSIIAGVCSGLAVYFGLQKNGIRVAFVLTTLLLGFPAIVYLVLWLTLPKYPSSQAMARQLRRQANKGNNGS